MNVIDLIEHLAKFAKESPQNGHATVMLQGFDDMVYGIAGANNAKGMYGEHFLIIVPDLKQKVGVRTFKAQ